MAIIVNELLCYVRNHFGNHPRSTIRTAVIGFYSEDEVANAKQSLFKFADSLPEKPEGLPRFIRCTTSDNKMKLECDDLLNLFAALDEAKICMPTYAAVDLVHIPSVTPGEVDIYAVSSSV